MLNIFAMMDLLTPINIKTTAIDFHPQADLVSPTCRVDTYIPNNRAIVQYMNSGVLRGPQLLQIQSNVHLDIITRVVRKGVSRNLSGEGHTEFKKMFLLGGSQNLN